MDDPDAGDRRRGFAGLRGRIARMRGAPGDFRAELGEHKVGVLSCKRSLAENHGVTGPRVSVERVDADREPGWHGVEVDVADELEQVRLFVDEDTLEAVLREVAGAVMHTVEGGGVGAEPALREAGQGECSGAQEGMGVVGHEGPGVEGGARGDDQRAEAIEEPLAVLSRSEEAAALDAADNDVVQGARRIETRAT